MYRRRKPFADAGEIVGKFPAPVVLEDDGHEIGWGGLEILFQLGVTQMLFRKVLFRLESIVRVEKENFTRRGAQGGEIFAAHVGGKPSAGFVENDGVGGTESDG